MSSMVDVHLHGPLADKYGRDHRFLISTPREAVAALNANHPGFLADFAANGRYLIIADGDVRDGEEAATMPLSRELHLCPQIEGGVFLGALAVGALIPSLAGTVTATIIGGVLFAGLLLGVSLLFMPSVDEEVTTETEKDENFAFSGPENITVQGVPVPLIYGRVYAGSVVISAGLELGEYVTPTGAVMPVTAAVAPATTLPPPAGGWPAIVDHDSEFGIVPGPDGWVNSQTTISTIPDTQPPLQQLMRTWTPGNNPLPAGDGSALYYYAWNEVRGYFAVYSTSNDGSGEDQGGGVGFEGQAAYTPSADEYVDE